MRRTITMQQKRKKEDTEVKSKDTVITTTIKNLKNHLEALSNYDPLTNPHD